MNTASRQTLLTVLGAGIGVVVIAGAAYYIADARATARAAAAAPWFQPTAATEPIEFGGIEGLPTGRGILITAIDGRAGNWGLQVGDTVRTMDGKALRDPNQLNFLRPGTQLGIERRGTVVNVTAGTMAQPGQMGARAGQGVAGVPAAGFAAGPGRLVDARGVEGRVTPNGLWISAVDGDARRWGLRAGDLIRAIDGRPVDPRQDITFWLRTLTPRTTGVTFEVVRNGARVLVPFNTAAGGQTQAALGGQAGTVATTGQQFWGGGTWGGLSLGISCPACGAWHPPGWNAATCGRCGAALMPTPPPRAQVQPRPQQQLQPRQQFLLPATAGGQAR